jgi:enamine deaminase RidA (YjgF/YER057c/UK114 family)
MAVIWAGLQRHVVLPQGSACCKIIEAEIETMPERRPITPSQIRPPFAAYSHGLLVPAGGDILVTSGQLGARPDDTIPEDVEAQCVICFENLAAILAEAQMGFEHVVRFSGFVTDRAFFPIYGKVRSRYVSGDAFTSTLLVVSGFTRPEFKVEVEITAIR